MDETPLDGSALLHLGFPQGKVIGLALDAATAAAAEGATREDILGDLADLLVAPDDFAGDPVYGAVVAQLGALRAHQERSGPAYDLTHAAPYRVWGAESIEAGALDQMKRAVRLPVAVRGALMPDAHQGYGLPIGGVLATANSVIPYAVGVDIACRMCMTVFNESPHLFEKKREKLRAVLEEQTCFGAGAVWDSPREHEVMDDPLWETHPLARRFKDLAWQQLGTSGSGNHFVEFGTLSVSQPIPSPRGTIPPGTYIAALSHSGSRRFGLEIAEYYTKVAKDIRSRLPKDFLNLAWLDLDADSGAEYWQAMTLAGRYASANHAVIHRQIIDALRLPVLGGLENHHNYAWIEQVDGQDVVVHRKGATPAGAGVLGVIPGSMSAPGYVVRGLGSAESLASASHGAGRRMSRKQALASFTWESVQHQLKAAGVELIAAGLDEAPGAYKDIREVMMQQADLVEPLAEFQPRMVRMDGGDKPRTYGGQSRDRTRDQDHKRRDRDKRKGRRR